MIPKIIHQIWLGDQNKRPIELMKTWKELNPTWEYKVWTEKEMFPLINQMQFNQYGATYNGKANILRYEILYNYGGFFIDADSTLVGIWAQFT